jgi:hypothetical protein
MPGCDKSRACTADAVLTGVSVFLGQARSGLAHYGQYGGAPYARERIEYPSPSAPSGRALPAALLGSSVNPGWLARVIWLQERLGDRILPGISKSPTQLRTY